MPRSSSVAVNRPRYRHISTRMWADEKFRALSKPKPNGQSLWQFLLTGPHTRVVPGLFSIGEAGLAESIEWTIGGFRKAWRELESREMVKADWAARVIWIPNAVQHNPPESPNVVRSWRVTLEEIPECALKGDAVAMLRRECEAFGEAFAKAFREACPSKEYKASVKPYDNQEQEQEQEQDQEQEKVPPALRASPPPSVPTARSKRPIFTGQRVTVFEWMRNECRKTLGPHFDTFDIDEWFHILDAQTVAAEVVVPKRDGGQWLQAQLVAEAQRRGLALRMATAVPLRARRCRHTPQCPSDVDCTRRDLEEQLHPRLVSIDVAVSQ